MGKKEEIVKCRERAGALGQNCSDCCRVDLRVTSIKAQGNFSSWLPVPGLPFKLEAVLVSFHANPQGPPIALHLQIISSQVPRCASENIYPTR